MYSASGPRFPAMPGAHSLVGTLVVQAPQKSPPPQFSGFSVPNQWQTPTPSVLGHLTKSPTPSLCQQPHWAARDVRKQILGVERENGLRSGTLVLIHTFDYNEHGVLAEHREEVDIKDLPSIGGWGKTLLASARPPQAEVRWMNIDSRNKDMVRFLMLKLLGRKADAELAFDSSTKHNQRVKTHCFGNVFFLLSRIPSLHEDHERRLISGDKTRPVQLIEYEKIIFLFDRSNKTVITLQGGAEGDCWDPLRKSLRENRGGHHDIIKNSCAHLFWNLLNECLVACDDIDSAFGEIIHKLRRNVVRAEERSDTASSADKRIAQILEAEMVAFRRRVLPLRETFTMMVDQSEKVGIVDMEKVFFEDLRDQSLRIMDNIEGTYNDSIFLQQKYDALEQKKDGRVQFIISMALAFFSPLSFIVGLYGMNFTGDPVTGNGGIPELTWERGYTFVWLLMMAVVICIFGVFFYLGILPLPAFIKRWNEKVEAEKEAKNKLPAGGWDAQGAHVQEEA